uniref:Uncharacterized protein n=1 Tax=Aegilops tauschii subsp. strangulata TaxID=200361 RepID=A0A453R3H6_AEGTS
VPLPSETAAQTLPRPPAAAPIRRLGPSGEGGWEERRLVAMWPGCGGRFYWAPAPPSGARGVVVVFAWVWSDEAQLRPFVELYASLGWRCLVCHPDLVSLYLSEKAATLACGVISELAKV